MSINIAINGYGRIGRCIVRSVFERNLHDKINIVAINDLSGIQTSAHLTRHDSAHGLFPFTVEHSDDHLIIDGKSILITANKDPEQLPWASLKVDIVLDCTGRFTDGSTAKKHLNAGAKKVLISAPGTNVDSTIVYGVNHESLKAEDNIVSNASCTTNCLAPVAKALHNEVGIVSGLMNTIHAYTKDQMLVDGCHSDLRRARAAAHSIIPTKTGAAKAVGLVLPELAGKLDGFATRVPTLNVSVVDLTFKASRPTSVEEINGAIQNNVSAMHGVITINNDPLVSCDFNHNPASSIFDATQTKVIGDLVKVLAWYDNEWGFSNRMLDTAIKMMSF